VAKKKREKKRRTTGAEFSGAGSAFQVFREVGKKRGRISLREKKIRKTYRQ